MSELAVPIAVMLSLSAALACAGVHLGRRLPRPATLTLCLLAVALMLTHALYLGDNLLLARLLPVTNVIIWGNLQPPAAALLAGLAWSALKTPRWQRILLITVVSTLALYRAYWPFAGPVPRTQNTWFADVCKQSTLSTCSAAAAATALRQIGIDASESEMADLCLTRAAGTTNLGIYRGLRLKTAGTPHSVEIFTGPLDTLASLPGPAVLSVGSTYRDPAAWPLVGNRHSVVLLGRLRDGTLDVADPYTGRHQHLTLAAVQSTWDGRALRLVRK